MTDKKEVKNIIETEQKSVIALIEDIDKKIAELKDQKIKLKELEIAFNWYAKKLDIEITELPTQDLLDIDIES
tara:strand:+ start:772 stop:990 length:219 start_codon:yes stop_codon:yes gene_type:complete